MEPSQVDVEALREPRLSQLVGVTARSAANAADPGHQSVVPADPRTHRAPGRAACAPHLRHDPGQRRRVVHRRRPRILGGGRSQNVGSQRLVSTILIRGYDADADDYGRHLIALIRQELAYRSATAVA